MADQEIRGATREELTKELNALRRRLAELEHVERAEGLLRTRMEELTALHAIAAAGAEATSLDSLFSLALEVISRTLGSHAFGIGLVDEQAGVLCIHPLAVKANELHGETSIPLGKGITGRVAASGHPARVDDTTAEPGYIELNSDMRSELCVPLKTGNRVIGVFNAESRTVGAFSETDERLLMTFAGQLATAIEKVRLFEEVASLAVTDPLTGLFNRRHFFSVAGIEFQRAKRHGRDLALIMLDLDYFKVVNDKFGHAAGDLVLRTVATQCLSIVRATDLICRFGGEEFTVLLPETTPSSAVVVAEELRREIAHLRVRHETEEIMVTASMGVAGFDDACDDLEHLLRRSDHALYAAKRAGRDCVRRWPVEA